MTTQMWPRVDENGREVKRTQEEYPYTYDPYVVLRAAKNERANCTIYSDRMMGWDPGKYQTCVDKHLEGQEYNLSTLSKDAVESFIRDYFDNQDIELVFVMQCCNQATGYTLWRIDFFDPHKDKGDE